MIAELQVRREGSVGWIVFSNPSKHNAVTYDMIVRLPDAVAQHERDPQVRVIAFRGAGEQVFVSGADVTEFGRTRGSIAATTTYNQAMENVYRAIIAARKPTLACIRGACYGVGISIASYCDLRLCAEDALFAQPVARIGIALSVASTKRLVDLLGPARAADILLTGRRIAAAEALRIGLVDRLAPAAALDQAFAELAGEIAEGAPLSLAAAKLAIRAALSGASEADEREARAAIDAAHSSDDYVEGRTAFAAKRKPVFRGR